MLLAHADQESVQKVEAGFRLHNGEDHQGLVHIGHGRAHQFTVPGKQFCDISHSFLPLQHLELHIIPYQGFPVVLSEYSLSLTRIETGRPISICLPASMDIIESCNPFYNLPPHESPLGLSLPKTYSSVNSTRLLKDLGSVVVAPATWFPFSSVVGGPCMVTV